MADTAIPWAEKTWNVTRRWCGWPLAHGSAFRWWLAYRLAERPDTCWGDLAMWAMYDPFKDVRQFIRLGPEPFMGWPSVVRCRRKARQRGHCTCAKFSRADMADQFIDTIIVGDLTDDDVDDAPVFVFAGDDDARVGR